MSNCWREDELRKIVSRVGEIFNDFRVLIHFYLAFFILCLIIFLFGLAFPWFNLLLVASRSTPWGIFTSIFIHNDLLHLVRNMVGLFSFFLIFSFTNYFLPSKEKINRVSFLTITLLTSTVLSNLIWILIVKIGTIGASGLVYASEGAVTGFCLVNFWDLYELGKTKASRKTGVLLVNLSIFILVCIWMIFYTYSFLSYERDANVLIHGSSFVIAFILAIEWGSIKKVFGFGHQSRT